MEQVHDLDVDLGPVEGAGFSVIRAYANIEPRSVAEKLSSWHEVTVSSKKANDLFKKSMELELGGLTNYGPEHLSQFEGIEAIYGPALVMLKQMDGVGFYNDNGSGTADFAKFTRQKKDEDTLDLLYW